MTPGIVASGVGLDGFENTRGPRIQDPGAGRARRANLRRSTAGALEGPSVSTLGGVAGTLVSFF